MKTLRSIVVAAALVVAAPAFADPTISLGGKLAEKAATTLNLTSLGQSLYNTQEGVHSTVTAATGIAVPHDYVHVEVGGADVPIDPPRVVRSN